MGLAVGLYRHEGHLASGECFMEMHCAKWGKFFRTFGKMKDATNVVAGKPDDMNATIPFENDDPPTPNIRENLQCELETIRCSLPPGSLSMKLGGSGPIRNDACQYVFNPHHLNMSR